MLCRYGKCSSFLVFAGALGQQRAEQRADRDRARDQRQRLLFRDIFQLAVGALWLLREPIKEHAPKLTRKIQDLASEVADHFRVADEPADEDEIETLEEDDHEAVR